MKKVIRWNPEKGSRIRKNTTRGGIGFEECLIAIEESRVLDVIRNPSVNFPDQRAYVLNIEGYAYLVPFVEDEEEIFLKTLYPSRKLTAFYLDKKEP